MRLRRKKGPSKAFSHSPDCKIQAADPTVSIEWQEVERGYWEARCVCGIENYREPGVDDRVRLDPLDPKTAGSSRYTALEAPLVIQTAPAPTAIARGGEGIG
jgi:hypothetical protein